MVRLLNLRSEPVKVYQGSQIAILEQVEGPITVATATEAPPQELPSVPQVKQELLWRMVVNARIYLQEGDKMALFQLLLAFSVIFSSSDSDLGRTSAIHYEITTTSASPIRQSIQRIPPFKREEVQQPLSEMQEKDIIQRSNSPWASPIVLVTKKDGTTRFYMDYRKLNEGIK